MLGVIAADRHLKDYQVKTYVDRGLFTAEDAKKAGLIDDVLYTDQLEEAIKKDLKTGKVEVVTNYKKHKIDADFSGLGGMVKLIEIFSAGNRRRDRQEAENCRGLRRWPDYGGQRGRRHVRLVGDRFDDDGRGNQESDRRPEGAGHRAADR